MIEYMAKMLVDLPDQVEINEIEGENTTVIELKVAKEDLGKIIGKQGRTARAVRTVLNGAPPNLENAPSSKSSSRRSVGRRLVAIASCSFHFLTLFPEVFAPVLASSLLGKARKQGLARFLRRHSDPRFRHR